MSTANPPTIAPPGAPTEVTPPPEAQVTPRQDRPDLLFVGYRDWPQYKWYKDQPVPPSSVATTTAELPGLLAALAKRDADSTRYPYLWLAPELAQEFEDRMVGPIMADWAMCSWWATLAPRAVDLSHPLWACKVHPAGCGLHDEDYDSESYHERYNPALLVPLPNESPEDRARLLKATDENDLLFDLRDQLRGPKRGSLGELIERWQRDRIKHLLHTAEDGWLILLAVPDKRYATPSY